MTRNRISPGIAVLPIALAIALMTGCAPRSAGASGVAAGSPAPVSAAPDSGAAQAGTEGTDTPGGSPSPADARAPARSSPPDPVSPARATVSAAAPCRTDDLTAQIEGHGAGAGQRYTALGLTNAAAAPCTIQGYPGLQLLDSNGAALPTDISHEATGTPPLVVLAPGHAAWTQLHWTVIPADDEAASHCAPDPTAARITPPGQTSSLTVAFGFGAVCQHGSLGVRPFGPEHPPMDG